MRVWPDALEDSARDLERGGRGVGGLASQLLDVVADAVACTVDQLGSNAVEGRSDAPLLLAIRRGVREKHGHPSGHAIRDFCALVSAQHGFDGYDPIDQAVERVRSLACPAETSAGELHGRPVLPRP